MSLSINEVINAQVMPEARAAARRDLSRVALFTPEIGQAFTDNTTRYITVASAQDVANLFGSQAAVTQAANRLFSVRPRPARAIIARWAREKQVIPAVAAALNGATLSVGLDRFRRITDGALLLTLDGQPLPLLNMDFSHADGMSAVIDIIKAALPKDAGSTALWDETGRRIIFRAKKAGADGAPRFGMAQNSTTGTDLAPLLKLQAGQATRIEGQNATELAPESPADALGKLENQYQNWYGVYFAAPLTDGELINAHDWVVSAPSAKVMAFTALQDAQLAWDNANVLKTLHDKNSGRLMVQYNKTGDDHAAAALLGIALSTNWRALNSANTVKFKQQTSVKSDDRITLNDAEKARRLGINFYTDYDGIPMLAEGTLLGGIFIDETVGLDAFLDACQKQAFSTLQGDISKIPQTDKGQAQLIGALIPVGEEFVRNGFLAGGIWRGKPIGALDYGDRLDAGYYFYSDSYDLQLEPDHEQRKAMPILCAIKLAGAIHSLDLSIAFNR